MKGSQITIGTGRLRKTVKEDIEINELTEIC